MEINIKKKVKSNIDYAKNNKKEIFHRSIHNSIAVCLLLSVILNIFVESVSRHSIVKCWEYFAQSPMTFFYNCFMIFATLSIAFLAKRRFFVYVIISSAWIGLGVTNGIVLSTRTTPFTVFDFAVANDGLSLITSYLSTFQIVLVGVGILVVLASLVLMFIFAPKHKGGVNYKKSILGIVIIAILMGGLTSLAINQNWVSKYFGNLNYAYRDYGFPYCFVNTWLNTGVSKPSGYSKEQIDSIFTEEELSEINNEMEEIRAGNVKESDKPNIVMLQMESFFDPTLIKGITFSEDPIPTFRSMRENFSSGFLTVPSIGAGTANTEFETITGMRTRYFGPGEYPYKSILTERTSASMCYDLAPLGYSSHAIHNHRGVFYGRNKIFANLGFDTFTSIEYMIGATRTPRNWAKDEVLTAEIFNALNSTENHDLVFAISVQGHGQYPTEPLKDTSKITVSGIDIPGGKVGFEYYMEQLLEMDEFLKDLTDELNEYDEDVVLVIYGDHLPGLPLEDEDLVNGDIYETEYIIWSNFEMEKEDKPLHAYQLGAEVLGRIDIDSGVLNKYHQNHQNDESYMENLKTLQYDMLYGEMFIYGEGNPYIEMNLKMGVNDVKINEILEIGDHYFIMGENFTTSSKISIGDEILKTYFMGPTTLGLEKKHVDEDKIDLEDIAKMKISQVESKSRDILSTTE